MFSHLGVQQAHLSARLIYSIVRRVPAMKDPIILTFIRNPAAAPFNDSQRINPRFAKWEAKTYARVPTSRVPVLRLLNKYFTYCTR